MGDKRIAPPESARAQSLLANLVLHDGAPQSRQRLAFLLWPDSTEGQARTNLRHLLHTLRTTCPALEPYLDVTSQTLRWSGREACWTDVTAFQAAVTRADDAVPASDDELAALRDAIELYGGDLLDGCYDEWLLEERQRLHDRYTWALRRVTGLMSARGNHAEAIRLGRELLRLDPLREDTYQLLMRLHDGIGDRAGAVRTYHECVSTLRRELGMEPSELTASAYAALMRPGQAAAPESPRRPAAVARAALVGREDEWRRAADYWHDAATGRARLLLVSGEPGIGKTRLVEDLAVWCAHHGAVVAQGRSYPSEGNLGYGVALSWLRSAELAAHVRRAAGRDRAELARLVPELGPAEPDAADPAEQRRRLFEAASRALVVPRRATLLVADDVQWCDEQTLQLIHYLLRLEPNPPVLVVGTVRREDLDDDHPLTALVTSLGAIDRVSEIPLGRLARAGTEALARSLADAGHDLDPTAVDGLHAETEGNPLFIVERLRAGWPGPSPQISPRLKAVITGRLRQVSEPARDLLGLAATVGREFTAGVLAPASGMDDITLVRALDELWRRGIVREQGTDAYDFSHGRIREVAYEALRPGERRRNHRLIAEALVRVRSADVDLVSGEIARHYERSGAMEDAVTWYRRAAVQAQRLHASAEAVRLLEGAGQLVAALPDGTTRRAHELAVLSALPTPLTVTEGFASPRLREIQRRVLELAAESGVEPEPALLRSLVMSGLCRHDFEGARTLARRLRDGAVAATDHSLLVETEYLLGIGAFWAGALAAARSHFERVVADFDATHRAEHLLRFGQDPSVVCMSRLANTLWFLGEVGRARATRDAALALADEVGHAYSREVAYVFAAVLAVDLQEPAAFERYVAVLTGEGQHQAVQVAAGAFLGYADVLHGREEEGIRRIRDVVDSRPVDHAPGQRAVHFRLLVAAHDAAGEPEGGLQAADEALAAPGTRLWDGEHRRLRATFLAALGRER